MHFVKYCILKIILLGLASPHLAHAEDKNLLPKYGLVQKSESELAADARFVAGVDEDFKGNRKLAAKEVAARGWQELRLGHAEDAMRRFNQAWLLDAASGVALWGMASVQVGAQRFREALGLFAEASVDPSIGNDIDFAVDYAKAVGIAGATAKDKTLLDDAFARFAKLHKQAPQNVTNLQNWAITYFYLGDYAEAWNKIRLAEAMPLGDLVDPAFIFALQAKMPRPTSYLSAGGPVNLAGPEGNLIIARAAAPNPTAEQRVAMRAYAASVSRKYNAEAQLARGVQPNPEPGAAGTLSIQLLLNGVLVGNVKFGKPEPTGPLQNAIRRSLQKATPFPAFPKGLPLETTPLVFRFTVNGAGIVQLSEADSL